jgi:hypothetical protein
MKTNRTASPGASLRVTLLVVTIAVIALVGFRLSESLAARVNQEAAAQAFPIPNVGLADLVAAASTTR